MDICMGLITFSTFGHNFGMDNEITNIISVGTKIELQYWQNIGVRYMDQNVPYTTFLVHALESLYIDN